MSDLSHLSDAELLALAQQHLAQPQQSTLGIPTESGFTPQVQRNRGVTMQGVNQGLAGGLDMFLNAPVNAWNIAKSVPSMLQGEQIPDLTQTPDFASRGFKAAGFIKPENEPQTTGERILAAGGRGVGGMAVAPGRSISDLVGNLTTGAISGLAGQGTTEATGNQTAGDIVSTLTPAGLAGGRKGAEIAQQKADLLKRQNSVRDETLAKARELGLVIPKSEIEPTFLTNRAESFAGKAALGQEANLRNQAAVSKIVPTELGMPEGTPITEQVLNDYRNRVSKPYRDVAAISPVAASTLDDLRTARHESKIQWKYYDRSADPAAQKAAIAADQQKTALENQLDQIANNAGRPDLVPAMRDARTQIAKSYDIERALNLGSANISAPSLGSAYDKGVPLTGNLETIAKFQLGPGSKFSREGDKVPSPGVSHAELYGSALLGGLGTAAFGPAGAAGAALPFLRGPTRSLLLSKMMQKPQDYSGGAISELAKTFPSGSREQTALRTLLMTRQLEGANQ